MLEQMTSPSKPRHVYVVGAGLSGLACALQLHQKRVPVSLFEATQYAGGRCRTYEDKSLNCRLDNGNHLILRANRATVRYINRLNATKHFYKFSDNFAFMDVQNGKRWNVKLPFIRDAWRLYPLILANKNQIVSECFDTQSEFYSHFITPFCLAALNTHPEKAAAWILRSLIWRLAFPKAADYLQVRTHFDKALINPVIAQLPHVEFMQRLQKIELQDNRISALQFTEYRQIIKPNDRVVLALPPDTLAKLLPSLKLPEFEYHTIVNGHFKMNNQGLSPRVLATVNSPLHWVFLQQGILSTTTSHAENSALYNKHNIAEMLWQEVAKCYPTLRGRPMPEHRIVTEKRATLAASPKNLALRPSPQMHLTNAHLAGDWFNAPLPSCIEHSIQSGQRAARWCLKQAKQ